MYKCIIIRNYKGRIFLNITRKLQGLIPRGFSRDCDTITAARLYSNVFVKTFWRKRKRLCRNLWHQLVELSLWLCVPARIHISLFGYYYLRF